jgi:hypothetical protein
MRSSSFSSSLMPAPGIANVGQFYADRQFVG